TESFGLLANYGRFGFGRSRLREIFGQDRPGQKQNAANAWVWSHDRLSAARQERRAYVLDRAQSSGKSVWDGELETARHPGRGRPRLFFSHRDRRLRNSRTG